MNDEDQKHCQAAAKHIQQAIDEIDQLSPEAAYELNEHFVQQFPEPIFNWKALRAAIAKLFAQ